MAKLNEVKRYNIGLVDKRNLKPPRGVVRHATAFGDGSARGPNNAWYFNANLFALSLLIVLCKITGLRLSSHHR